MSTVSSADVCTCKDCSVTFCEPWTLSSCGSRHYRGAWILPCQSAADLEGNGCVNDHSYLGHWDHRTAHANQPWDRSNSYEQARRSPFCCSARSETADQDLSSKASSRNLDQHARFFRPDHGKEACSKARTRPAFHAYR